MTFDFFNAALLYAFLSSNLKIVHVFTDNNVFTDAVILFKLITDASHIDIIQLQYSCLAWPNPLMLSSADSICMFNDDFKNSFTYKDFGPRKIINSDYIFNIPDSQCSIHAENKDTDISFLSPFDCSSYDLIIGYLDESIQVDDCWPAISFERAYRDFYSLCNFVVQHENMALVTKPQFQVNAPSNIFSSMPPLIQLINENRYFELGDNSLATHRRNNLLPSVAFQDVDICIGSALVVLLPMNVL